MKGLDYSFDRPGAENIANAGYQFVIRYVPYQGDGGKGLTRAELTELHKYNLGVGLVFESVAERHKAGHAAGVADAQLSKAAAKSLGFPDNCVIYFAVDFDTAESDQDEIDDYQRGAISVLGINRVGVYGSYYVCKRCYANGTAKYLWQTYAWSGGQTFEEMHVYQYQNGGRLNGAAVDYNEAYGTEQGFYYKGGTETAFTPNDKVILDEASRSAEQASQQLFGQGDPSKVAYVEIKPGTIATMAEVVKAIHSLETHSGGMLSDGEWRVVVAKNKIISAEKISE